MHQLSERCSRTIESMVFVRHKEVPTGDGSSMTLAPKAGCRRSGSRMCSSFLGGVAGFFVSMPAYRKI